MPKKYEIIYGEYPFDRWRRKIVYAETFVGSDGRPIKYKPEVANRRNLSQLGTCQLPWNAKGLDMYFGDTCIVYHMDGTPLRLPRYVRDAQMRIYGPFEPPAKLFRFVRS